MHRSRWTRALRALLIAAGIAAAGSAVSAGAAAFPDKPITLVVPQAPGGSNDIVARLYAKEMAGVLGQPVVVDNRPGAGGNIGTAHAARAAPNGYTLLMTVNSTQAINPQLYRNAGFDPVKDFTAIGGAGSVPNVLLAAASVQAGNLQALVRDAKARPGEIRYGSAGNGTLPHMMAALLAERAGVAFKHIPYKGISPALTAMLAGQIDMAFATLPAALPHIKAGTLRPLGVTSPERAPVLPEVPAIGESYPGYQGVLWIALYAPAGTPAEVLAKLRQALDATRQSAPVRAQLAEMGVAPLDESPAQLERRLAQEIGQWGELIRKAGIVID